MEDHGQYLTNEGALVVTPQENSLISVEQDRAVAEVQAAIVIAKRYPRDAIRAIDKIVNACSRPGLAEKALYQYAKGGTDITGPSIRLAEVIAQNWGNLVCGVTELTRRTGESDCMSYAWDLESNFRDEKRFTVRHVRDTKLGVVRLEKERDLYELIANMGARRKRACILAVIPGDVVEAAEKQCEATLAEKASITPDRISAMLDRFSEFGVTKDQIEKRIQRHLDAITPAQLINLGKIYNSMRDGISSASDWFEKDMPMEGPKSGLDKLKDKLRGEPAAKTKVSPTSPPTYPPAVKCTICGFEASSPQGLKRHHTQQHEKGPKVPVVPPTDNINETFPPPVVETTSSGGTPPMVDFDVDDTDQRADLQNEIMAYAETLDKEYWDAIITYYRGWESDQAAIPILEKMLDQCKKALHRQQEQHSK